MAGRAWAQSDLPGTEGAGVAQGIQQATQAQLEGAFPPPRGIGLSFSGDAMTTGEADFEEGGGSMSVRRWSASAGYRIPLRSSWSFVLSADREWSAYTFSGADRQDLDTALDDASVTRFGFNVRGPVSENWSAFVSAGLSHGVASDADWSDGRRWNGLAIGRYQWSSNFAFSLGVLAGQRLEDDPLIIPIPGIDWRITDRLRVQTAQGVTLGYSLDERKRWIADLAVSFDRRSYRVGRGPMEGQVVYDRRVPILAGINYAPHPTLLVRLYGGFVGWQQFELREDNDELDNLKTEDTWMTGLYLRLRL